MGERRGTKALEAWCKRVTQGYPNVKVENMTTSWRDGLAFCALIHHFRPDLIDFDSLGKSDVIGNNELAFSIAERHLGIPALLDAEDMAEYQVPDRLSILTYLSQFYQVFCNHSASPGKKPTDSDSSISSLSDVPSSPNMEGAPPWRELCVVCSHPVYLAQRLRVQGHLYHRTCFRCARCSAQLTLVDYYETHDGKFVCETCPDERPPAPPPPDEGVEPRVATTRAETAMTPALTMTPAVTSVTPPLTTMTGDTTLNDEPVELSPAARQSIVAMRRMFFDTDDAKLTRSETLRADLPPADIPITPNDRVKPQIVNTPVDDKTRDSPKIVADKSDSPSSLELPNTGACVEYQSDNASPSILRLADKSNSSLNLEDNLADKSNDRRTSRLNDSPPEHETQISSFSAHISPTKEPERTANQLKSQENEEIGETSKCALLENIVNIEEISSNVVTAEVSSNTTNAPSKKLEKLVSDENAGDLDENEKVEQNSRLDESKEIKDRLQIEENDDYGERESRSDKVVEAVNDMVAPPRPPKRRQKSPKAASKGVTREYPQDLNPFGDEDEDEDAPAGTNPFGSDSDEEAESKAPFTSTPIKRAPASSAPVTSPYKNSPSVSPRSDRRMSDLSPVRKAPSLNPFEDSDEEELEDVKPAMPVPLPRKTAPSPEPMPFPRSALRASQRSIASTMSTSSRKKRPAPPPPVPVTSPPSPSTTIRSTRSRKARRAPLPPGITSSRLSLASDTISIGGDSVYRADASSDFPEQVSQVADRISEWVEATNLEVKVGHEDSYNDSRVSDVGVSTDVSANLSTSLPVSTEPDSPHKTTDSPRTVPAIEVTDEQTVHVRETECHIEVPKTEPIARSPISSPVRKDLSPTFDNKIIKSPGDVTFRKKIVDDDENIKEISETRKSFTEPDVINDSISSEKPVAPLEPSISITNRYSLADSDVEDRLLSNKKNKDDVNMTRKISGGSTGSSSGGYSLHKSAHGQWRRKTKAPAPPLPLAPDPNRSTLKKGAQGLPLFKIKQELNDIEIKQQGLERQGVELEARIRDKFDSDASITPYVEELVLQLFELVNEKNELFRKQAELMYLRRQQHLEEEQAELEKEIRGLMSQPEVNKTDSDKELEEQLIQRLVEVVERRDAIVQCLEMDRIREAEEDRSISAQLNVFTKAMAPEDKSATSPKKKKTNPDGSKKKWYTLSRSPKKSHS